MQRLSAEEYFALIDSNQYAFEIQNTLDNQIPCRLYKYFSIPDSKKEWDKRLKQIYKGKMWFSKKRNLNDLFEFEHINLQQVSKETQDYYKKIINGIEIMCFTDDPCNKLMWAHYADSYKGFCIEFHVKSPSSFSKVFYEDQYRDLHKSYENLYSNRNKEKDEELFDKLFYPIQMDERCKDYLRINYAFLTKDKCWEYENEYRIITSSVNDGSAGHLHPISEFSLVISSIIIGPYCEPKDIADLKAMVKQMNVDRFQHRKQGILKSSKCTEVIRKNIDQVTQQLLGKDDVVQLYKLIVGLNGKLDIENYN